MVKKMLPPHLLIAEWMEDCDFEWERLERAGITWSLPSWRPPPPPPEQQRRHLLERIGTAPRLDAVLLGNAPFNAEVIDALPATCKLLQRMGVGLENVDVERARQRGIVVRNVPDYCVEEVVVHTIAMLLSLHRQLDATQRVLHSDCWTSVTPQPLERLSTLTLGIVGMGQIGRRLAELIRPLVARIVYHDPFASETPDCAQPLTLDDLLRQADMVSLNCSLTLDNRQIINTQTLALMKPTAILVNVSRGGLVDAAALAAALDGGRLAGAGLDVYEPEVLPNDSPLRCCQNTILTSHTAWYSRQAVDEVRDCAIKNILEAFGKSQ